MRRLIALTLILVFGCLAPAAADEKPKAEGSASTTPDGVRVTVVVSGGVAVVGSVQGGDSESHSGCVWRVELAPSLEDARYGLDVPPMPDPGARFALLFCGAILMRPIWIASADFIDLDAVAAAEAQRFVQDVLMPMVSIGVNPDSSGLVGLRSWFWIDGFTGSVQAPPINVFGMTIDVRMTSRSVTWDFGDGETLEGDLGRAYPAESSVQHAHRRSGGYRIAAAIHLVPEYQVNGGGWIPLPELTPAATTDLPVQEREPVLTNG
jgi:hypothetical protein